MGLFNKKTKNAKKEMEQLFNDVQIKLENNYKDLAISARKRAEERLEELKLAGEVAGKDYDNLKKKLDTYTERMKGYHH